MPSTPMTNPLLRLGRLTLSPELRTLQPGSAASGLVVTATVGVPDSASELQHAWDVAWDDAVREAGQAGADPGTAQALAAGAGDALVGGTRVVVAAHGRVLLARWLAPGAAVNSVRVGPLPHLQEVAAGAARRPAYVVVQAERDGTDIAAHVSGDEQPPVPFSVGSRPGLSSDPDPGRPPAQLHGERHVTDREPESGGQRNDAFIAGRVAEAAASVGAHIVLGTGDRHILDAVGAHLPDSVGPIVAIADSTDGPGLSAAIGTALDRVTTEAGRAVADMVASRAEGPDPAAVRGIKPVAEQLAEQQVAVLLLAADIAGDAGATYRIGIRPTEFVVDDPDVGVEVPLEDGLVWAALHQDAIVVQVPGRSGPLGGEGAAALLRRGSAG
jgi:hypothetical protein